MNEEELFKKNFPEFCTEKGGCLSPFYDLFEAGVEIATAELNKGIIQSLTKENAELKDDNKVMADNYSKMEQKFYDKLTQAKTFIKDYMIIVTGDHTTVCSVPEENRCINVLKLNEQAEQFLKEK